MQENGLMSMRDLRYAFCSKEEAEAIGVPGIAPLWEEACKDSSSEVPSAWMFKGTKAAPRWDKEEGQTKIQPAGRKRAPSKGIWCQFKVKDEQLKDSSQRMDAAKDLVTIVIGWGQKTVLGRQYHAWGL